MTDCLSWQGDGGAQGRRGGRGVEQPHRLGGHPGAHEPLPAQLRGPPRDRRPEPDWRSRVRSTPNACTAQHSGDSDSSICARYQIKTRWMPVMCLSAVRNEALRLCKAPPLAVISVEPEAGVGSMCCCGVVHTARRSVYVSGCAP